MGKNGLEKEKDGEEQELNEERRNTTINNGI